jgi:hypothetical protein
MSNITENDCSHQHLAGSAGEANLAKPAKIAPKTKVVERQNVQISKSERNQARLHRCHVNAS